MFFKKFPLVRQKDLKDCGVCCLSMVIQYYHGYVDLEHLRMFTKTSKQGVCAYHLIETAKQLGFHAYGIKTTLEHWKSPILPAIAYVKNQEGGYHYVVLYQMDIKKKFVKIADPALGLKKYSFFEFEKDWQGIFLILYPVQPIVSMEPKDSIIAFYFSLFKKMKNSYFKLCFLSFFLGVFLFLTTFYFEWLIEGIHTVQKETFFYVVMLSFFFLSLLHRTTEYVHSQFLFRFAEKLNYCFTTHYLKQLLFLPYEYYYNRTTGEVLQKVNDLVYVETFFVKLCSFFSFDCFLFLITFLFFMIFYSELFFLFFLYFLCELLFHFLYHRKYYQTYLKLQLEKEKNTNLISEMIHGFETIKGIHLEELFHEKFLLQYLDVLKQDICYHKNMFFHQWIKNSTQDSLYIAVIGVVVIGSLKNPNLLISLFLLRTVLSYFFHSVETVRELLLEYPKACQAYDRISFLNYFSKEEAKKKMSLKGNITFQNLSYSYDDEKRIFDHLCLTILRGEKILLLGATGSGKSTLLKILMKYHSVEYGMLELDGVDIHLLDQKSLNDQITYVNQQGFLFSDTLFKNIVMGRSVTAEYLSEILKICQVDEILKKRKLGLHTRLEENGFNFSGGERGRIMLARALMNPFQILLIDEGFSAMNPEMEYQILKYLFWKFPDKTILVVSHRKTSMVLFDRCYQLKEGKLSLV